MGFGLLPGDHPPQETVSTVDQDKKTGHIALETASQNGEAEVQVHRLRAEEIAGL